MQHLMNWIWPRENYWVTDKPAEHCKEPAIQHIYGFAIIDQISARRSVHLALTLSLFTITGNFPMHASMLLLTGLIVSLCANYLLFQLLMRHLSRRLTAARTATAKPGTC